jgi:signal transduction histidine kinase
MEIGSTEYFAYLTAAIYWALILCWAIILVFYWREYRRVKRLSPMIGTLLVVIFIDGARTLVESLYFGTWYTARTHLIPYSLWTLLSEPQYVILPKALTLIAALIILAVIVRRWFDDLEAEVTHRREVDALYAGLTRAHAELQASQQAQRELTEMIVHDMRTPLTSVISGLQTVAMLDESEGETRQILLQSAREGGQRLLRMVNDLLDINRLEAREMPLAPEEFAAVDAARAALATVESLAAEKELQLAIASADEDLRVRADPEITRRVLVNLLGNAVKFAPAGGSVTLTVAPAGGDAAEFSVADTGPGIAAEHLERIFDKFYQVEARTHGSRIPSTGLGLTFCRLAVEAHGGRIGVESTPGQGSRFWFTLPASRTPLPVENGAAAPNLPPAPVTSDHRQRSPAA